MLKHLIYVSSATVPFPEAALLALLETSRRNNRRDGLTGMLLYKDGNFMQVLEGEPAAVDTTFRRVEQDPRHAGVIVIEDAPIAAREFGDWTMGFRNLDDPAVQATPGYDAFMNQSLTGPGLGGDASAARLLLDLFRSGR